MPAQFFPQGLAVDPENFGGARLVAVGVLPDALNVLGFDLGEAAVEAQGAVAVVEAARAMASNTRCIAGDWPSSPPPPTAPGYRGSLSAGGAFTIASKNMSNSTRVFRDASSTTTVAVRPWNFVTGHVTQRKCESPRPDARATT